MNKTFTKLIIGMEAFFFLSLIMAFLYLYYTIGFKAGEQQKLNVHVTAIFTGLLLLSSGTVWWSERQMKKGNHQYFKVGITVSMALGLLFLVGQGREYLNLIGREQVTMSSSLFGTGFYALTGFHALHVLIGLIVLFICWQVSRKGYFEEEKNWSLFQSAGIYWHFVDLVWLIVFSIVYLLPAAHLFN